MKTLIAAALIACAASPTFANAAKLSDEAQIRQLIADYDKGYAAQDASIIGKYFDRDYQSFVDGEILGLTEAKADLTKVRDADLTLSSKIDRLRIDGNMAVATGVLRWQETPKSNPSAINAGDDQYTLALVKRGENWQIFSEHLSEVKIDRKLREQELRRAAAAYAALYGVADAEGMARFVDEKFVAVNKQGKSLNKAQHLAHLTDPAMKVQELQLSEQKFQMLADRVALETGQFTVNLLDQKGAPLAAKGSYSTVWKRQSGVWLMVSEHTSGAQ